MPHTRPMGRGASLDLLIRFADELVEDGLLKEEHRKLVLYRLQVLTDSVVEVPGDVERIVDALVRKKVIPPEERNVAEQELSLRMSNWTRGLMQKFSFHSKRGMMKGISKAVEGETDKVIN